jgi:hypothetical protein
MADSPTSQPSIRQPRAAVRAVLSLLIILHVVAVFLGPFAMPPGNSQLSAACAQPFQPYVEGLCLANGYRFFAPEPGPSHLIRYEVTLPDGSIKEGTFPDRQQHFPRLLYHRYFMLTEFINTIDDPAAPSDAAKAYARGYAEHLADEYQAKDVKLFLRRHYVPRMPEVERGMRLSDRSLYKERPLYPVSLESDANADR